MMRLRTLSALGFALLATPLVFAQPGAPAAHSFKGMQAMHGGMEGGGMGIVPPGTWWKNPETITSLTLTADQQKKLDDVFLQSRIGLIHLHASLEEEQLKLEPLLNSNPPDQVKTLAEISKIADLRADLEKADAKMLLSLRGVLTADQWTKLQADQRAHRDHARDDHRGDDRGGKRGPQGQGGPRGQGPNPKGPGMPPPAGGPPTE
jgi:Spy/CpxP family protein refolding chaperone